MQLRERFSEAPFLRSFHGWATVQWLCHLPIVIFLYFAFPTVWGKVSILYLALVSIYANAIGHWSTWQAARAEIKADEVANASNSEDSAP